MVSVHPPTHCFGVASVIQCCVLQLVSALLLSLSCCLLVAMHRLLLFYMRHASDRDRLNLNSFILSASHDTEIQHLTEGGEGTAGAWHPKSKAAGGVQAWVTGIFVSASLWGWAESFVHLAIWKHREELDC